MTTTDQKDQPPVSPAPLNQKQFNEELSLLVAVSAQLCPKAPTYAAALEAAVELIRAAEKKLKEFYEQPQAAPETKLEPPVPAVLPKGPSRKVVEESITEASRIILAKKLRTQPELEAMLAKYGVKAKSQLNDEQAIELMNNLKAILK